eukprot:1307172-Pleurochrysis_carterae.AAC.2
MLSKGKYRFRFIARIDFLIDKPYGCLARCQSGTWPLTSIPSTSMSQQHAQVNSHLRMANSVTKDRCKTPRAPPAVGY